MSTKITVAYIRKVAEDLLAYKEEKAHGHWTDRGSLSCRCSVCGCKSLAEFPVCLICGAIMDEEGERE